MPTYYVVDGEAHTRRRCRRLHRTGDRITRTEDTNGLDTCPRCTDDATDDEDEPDTCQEVKTDGDVCGRELPCQYHD